MLRSNYVLAGFETLSNIIESFMQGKKEGWDYNFTTDDINLFFNKTTSGFLHSFGQHFSIYKNYDKFINRELKILNSCINSGFFKDSTFFLDSGGFQISVGQLDVHKSNKLLELYYKFLETNHNLITKAFILDIPPGPGCKIFNNFKQVYDKNLESYLEAKNLPDEVRNKMVYIHHFRTPKLWNIFNKILKEEDMFQYFNYFGTGGVVANMRSDITIPCIIYILPLIPLLNETIKHNRKELHFHVLGGSSYRDILFYEFFRHHIKKVHDIDLHITYDSSGIFKGLMIGRIIYLLDNNNVKKISFKSSELNKRFDSSRRIIDLFEESFNVFFQRHRNLKKINIGIDSFYNPKTNTLYEDLKIYLMLYVLDTYSRIQEISRNFVENTYHYYENNELDKFSYETSKYTQNINSGKITRKQIAKSNIIIKSLDMLTNLDEDHCEFMINKYLAQDEFNELTKKKILTF
jgi:hypothetical protein